MRAQDKNTGQVYRTRTQDKGTGQGYKYEGTFRTLPDVGSGRFSSTYCSP